MNDYSSKFILGSQELKALGKGSRIGILGGAFDPAHFGHVAISEYMLANFDLDYVIWVVALRHPIKDSIHGSFTERVTKALALVTNPKILVSTIEQEIAKQKGNDSPIYTYEVINFLSKCLSDPKLYFIMGADNLVNFHKWNNWQAIVDQAQILVYDRKPYSKAALNAPITKLVNLSLGPEDASGKLVFCHAQMYDVSSTDLRKISKYDSKR